MTYLTLFQFEIYEIIIFVRFDCRFSRTLLKNDRFCFMETEFAVQCGFVFENNVRKIEARIDYTIIMQWQAFDN